ncbi:hypothetical protein GCM10027047_39060 [Rhodococcus aerolatus]
MSDDDTPGGGRSPLLVGAALVGAPLLIVVLLVLVIGGATPPPCGPGGAAGPGSSPGVGPLSPNGIPGAYVPLIQAAGTVCPEFPAPVIAAELKQESGFNPNAVSESGAQGIAQFMPATWPSYGVGSPFDPAAAIPAQAKYLCEMAGQISAANASGQLHLTVSVTEAALFGYNAGLGAVLASGTGVPTNSQSADYVPRIMDMARTEFSTAGTTDGAPAPAGGAGVQAGAPAPAAVPTGCGGAGVQVTVTQVTYPVPGGGGTQPADLYTPAGAGAGTTPRPVVVMVHGGGFFFGDRSELAEAAKAAAEHGYLVLNVDYDLGAPRWPRELDQVGAAIDYARTAVPGVDPARVALLGDSAGGALVLEAGMLGDHHGVQAVVSWSGPSNFTSLSAQVPPPAPGTAQLASYQQAASVADPTIYLGCLQVVCPDLWAQASPALSLTAGAPPVMMVNSTVELVPLPQVAEMTDALARQGQMSRTLVFPGDRHATAYTADANAPTLAWLDETLHFTPPPPPAAVAGVGSGGGGPAAQKVVAAAQSQLGVPYVWGGVTPGVGLDCSGLTQYAFAQAGVPLPRVAQDQYAATASTALPGGFNPASYQPGDLLFWGTPQNIHHVAIAIGNGQLIEAPDVGQNVSARPIYESDFFGATRPLGAAPAPGGPQ